MPSISPSRKCTCQSSGRVIVNEVGDGVNADMKNSPEQTLTSNYNRIVGEFVISGQLIRSPVLAPGRVALLFVRVRNRRSSRSRMHSQTLTSLASLQTSPSYQN